MLKYLKVKYARPNVRNNFEDDLDSAEKGILDGRYECAENLIEQIKKWEKDYE